MPPLFPLTLALYAVSCTLYFLATAQPQQRIALRLALPVLLLAFSTQALDIGWLCLHGQHPGSSAREATFFIAWLMAGAFPGGRGRAQWPTSASTVPWPLRADVTDALASFPVSDESPRAKQHDEYLEVLKELTDLENARLAYVAFTRAERGLAVSGHWWGPTQVKRRGPDRFLLGVREACLAGAGEVVH